MIVTRQGSDLVFRVAGDASAHNCFELVQRVLQISDKECAEAFRTHRIRAGTRVLGPDDRVRAGEQIRAQLAAGPQALGIQASEPVAWETAIAILYEDDHMLVVDKPAGLIMYPGSEGEKKTLANALAHHFAITGQDAFVRAVHRLDRDTTGACLYAKHPAALRLLDTALTARHIRREYLALVQGRPPARKGTIAKSLGRDRHVAGKMRVHPGGQTAVTHYEVLWQGERHALLRCELETGRTHQIRVHLASVGMPLLGDLLYGLASPLIGRQALHAERITWEEPYTHEQLQVHAPLPEDLALACATLGASTVR